jgi:hypothetical protein
MKELTFLDSDILFSFFAINEDKIKSYNSSGTTGNIELDAILSLVNQLEKNKEIICISEFSILELVCTLNRLNGSHKTAYILSKIYQISDVLPLNDLMIKRQYKIFIVITLRYNFEDHSLFGLISRYLKKCSTTKRITDF